VRQAWEAETRFPQQIVNGLRPFLMEAGLHFFKHRKRILYVSATKPQRHPAGQVFSDGITSILQTVEASPRIKRPDLATKILGEHQDTPEANARKAQLAADLHYLIHEGQVIEFSDGALELPLAPLDKSQQQPQQAKKKPSQPASAATTTTGTAEPEAASDASEMEQAEPESTTDTPAQDGAAHETVTEAESSSTVAEASVDEAASADEPAPAVEEPRIETSEPAELATASHAEAAPQATEIPSEPVEATAETVSSGGSIPADDSHAR
jgi:hypothetical protein